MDVTEEVVRNIAELVQLKVDDADIQQLTKGMQNILALADQMQAIDTDGIRTTASSAWVPSYSTGARSRHIVCWPAVRC